MSSSAADTAAGLGLDPEYLKFRQSISSSAKLSAVTVSSNVKLDNVEVLKSSDGYELWSQKMSVIFEVMGLYEIIVSGIDPSPLASAEELITFQRAQRQGLLVIIQVVSNEISGKLAKLKTPHDMWIYLRTSYRRDSTLTMSLRFDHLCASNTESVRQRYRRRNLYRPLKLNGIGLHIFRNPLPPAPPHIVKS
jgi:hypothetical protein